VASHLTAFLFSSHGAGWPAPGLPVRVRADHVVLDEDDGVVAFLALEAIGTARQSCDLALVACARDAAGPDALDDVRYLQSAAAALGAHFARPGVGPPAAVHRRRFAAPGRTLVSAVPGAAGAGAFGMLVVDAGALETAAALAGEPLARLRPEVVGIRLSGAPIPGVGGAEILDELARRLGGITPGAVIEFHGAGVAALPMRERIAMAALGGARLGASATVFPSDEVTRDYLRSRGRDAEWRRFQGGGEGFDRDFSLELDTVGTALDDAIRGVHFGPLAEDDDLRGLARVLATGAMRIGTSAQVILGGRAARAALSADGTLESLARGGVRLIDPGDAGAHLAPPEPALRCGDPEGSLLPASLARCARWLAGDTGAREAGSDPAAGARAGLDPAELLEPAEPAHATPVERGASHRPPRVPAPFDGPWRGVVLLVLGDRAGCEQVLAWGPRARALRGDADALATQLFRVPDPGAAARGLAHAGGGLVAGSDFGAGAHAEATARALAALGVRAVFATSFAPGFARTLALHGVLPLTWRGDVDASSVRAGDELEIPALPEVLAPGRRVGVRNLTRGLQCEVLHELDDAMIDIVHAGGLLGYCAGTVLAGARESDS